MKSHAKIFFSQLSVVLRDVNHVHCVHEHNGCPLDKMKIAKVV